MKAWSASMSTLHHPLGHLEHRLRVHYALEVPRLLGLDVVVILGVVHPRVDAPQGSRVHLKSLRVDAADVAVVGQIRQCQTIM